MQVRACSQSERRNIIADITMRRACIRKAIHVPRVLCSKLERWAVDIMQPGRFLRQVSKTLASQGHLTGGGKPYTATAVQKMLRGG